MGLKLVDDFSLIKIFLPSLNSTICHTKPVGLLVKMRQLRKEKEREKKKVKTHLPKPLLPNPTELEDFEVDLKLNLD